MGGLYFPSSSDAGSSGSLIYDYYWGTELYPRVGPLDIKVWTNCRFGMMGWAMLILCYAAKQLEATGTISDSMLVSVGLQQLYIAKFFLWEAGYWCTMDICHDRAGFYICWGRHDLPQLRLRPAAEGLPGDQRADPRVGAAAHLHRGLLHDGQGEDAEVAPPHLGVVGRGAALPLRARDHSGLLLERACTVRERLGVPLRDFPHRTPRAPGLPGRRALPVQVWQILGAVLRGGAVQNPAVPHLTRREGGKGHYFICFRY